MVNWQVANMDYIKEVKDAYNNKLKNKIFHLLCEYEEDGEHGRLLCRRDHAV